MNNMTSTLRPLQRVFAAVAIFALLLMTAQGIFVQTAFAAESAVITQGQNGKDALNAINPVEWVTGNVNDQKGHYVEGQSIPYRVVMHELTPNVTNTLVIAFDVVKSGKFAIDYITTDHRISENVNPCLDTGDQPSDPDVCAGVADNTFIIPAPVYSGNINAVGAAEVSASFSNLVTAEGNQVMKIWNGVIDDVAYTVSPDLSSEDEAQVTIEFTPSSSSVVISWGGHISSSVDYPGESAINIPGSPYHSRSISLNGASTGQRDLQLAASAVTPQGNVVITKQVINDNGGTLQVSDFPLFVGGTSVVSGESNTFDVGTYTVSETGDAGYAAGTWGGNCAADGTLVVEANQVYNCTITNDDIAPSLTLTKVVNGGPATAADFEVTATGPTSISGNGSAVSGASFDAGTYTLSEVDNSGVSGNAGSYSASSWSCTNNVTVNNNNEITLGLGESTECTITNTFVPADSAVLHVQKVLTQDNGGTEGYDDFSFYFDGVEYFWSSTSDMMTFIIPQSDLGTYSVTENVAAAVVAGRYDVSYNNCASLDLTFDGAEETCVITNNDIAPELTVIKHVVDSALPGDKNADDFTMQVSGTNVSNTSFAGNETGVKVTLDAGAYSVSEANNFGYIESPSADCTGTIDLGETKTCTITNTEPDPTVAYLTLVKEVTNDFGGTATSGDFGFNVGGDAIIPGIASGATVELGVGSYGISEFGPTGYELDDITGDCGISGKNGTITIEQGDLGSSFSCTFKNSDVQPTLTVIKHVENDNTYQVGTAVAGDFTITASGTAISQTSFSGSETGTVLTLNAGAYDVTEPNPGNYAVSYDNCTGTIAVGENKVCTVTNNDLDPTTAVVRFLKVVDNNYGGTATSGDFSFEVFDGVATTAVAHSGQLTLGVGDYAVTESSVAGYEFVSNNDFCQNGDFSITKAELGQSFDCVFTNADIEPKLTVTKIVQGGDAVVADFTLTVTGNGTSTDVISGEQNGFVAGAYVVSESATSSFDNYTATFSGACDADGNVDLALGEVAECVITNSAYTVTGFKWYDKADLVNSLPPNGVFDTNEKRLEGWEIIATDGVDIISTKTDVTGYYTLSLGEGDWTVSEVMQGGWTQTFPSNASGTCEFSFGPNLQVFNETCNFGNTIERQAAVSCDLFTATPNSGISAGSNVTLEWETTDADEVFITSLTGTLAKDGSAVVNPTEDTVYTLTARRYFTEQDYITRDDITNEYEEVTCQALVDVQTGGGGGGSTAPRCDLFEATRDGSDVTLNWETTRGLEIAITQDGDEIFTSDDDATVDAGEFTLTESGSAEFVLTVSRGTRSRTCTAEVFADNGPTPLVLGEQVDAVPLGAADTGAGGTAPVELPRLPLMALALRATRKNG